MDEAEFIAALRKLPLHPGARNLEDDAAILEIGGETLVITHDAMVEGVHFLPNQHPHEMGWRLVVANMSDLAAKGARPIGLTLGFMLSKSEGDQAFLMGMRDAMESFYVDLLGGDTVSTQQAGPRSFGITAIGIAAHCPVPSRTGAKVGDKIWVTGTLGAAMLAFEAMPDGSADDTRAFRYPWPLLEAGRDLAPHVTAMMDVSDGLLLDAFRMAEASEVSFAIDSVSAPVADPSRRMECLTWGEDFQLLFTLPDGVSPPLEASMIGTVEPRGFATLFLDGEPITNPQGLGYLHR